MKIAEYGDVFPPELDGVGAVIKNYCEQLAAMGDSAYYIAPGHRKDGRGFTFHTMLYAGVKIPTEPYRFGVPRLDARYRQNVRNIPFDIVHAHSPFSAGLEARRIAKKRGVPLVATFHSKYYDDFLQKTHSKLLARLGVGYVVRFYNKCDEVWTVNEATAEVLRSYGYKKAIRIMPNGTNIPQVSPEALARAEERIGADGRRVLLFVGQLNWKKNIRQILNAFCRIHQKENALLVMVGQGPSEGEIRAYCRELGLTNSVAFTGHIADRDTLMGIYSLADALLFPSIYDNAPMVVREAASVGTPAVLIRGSCAAEGITDDVNGILCENTPESVAEGAFRAIANSAVLGEAAKKTIPIPWQTVVSDARARYMELIEAKKHVHT